MANTDVWQISPPVEKKSGTTEPEQVKKELRHAIRGSNDVLVEAHTVLTPFPDTLVLDRAKLTVCQRRFFRTAEVVSVQVEDLMNITTSLGPFFGMIKITSRVLTSKPFTVGKFNRADALKIKRITQGYVIALQREIDCASIPTDELIKMLDKLGEDDHENAD